MVVKSDKPQPLHKYRSKYGLVLELELAKLTERGRKLLAQRVAEALQRNAMRQHQLSVMMLVLTHKPLPDDIVDRWEKDEANEDA